MKRQHPFNMVEILLALGVIAIGICSVMVLFPVGANASRDSIMEEYAAASAEQMLNMIKYGLEKNWDTYIGTNSGLDASHLANGTLTTGTDATPEPDPPDSNVSSVNDNLDLDKASNWSSSNVLLGGNALQGSIFSLTSAPNTYFQIVIHRDTATTLSSIGADKIDFRALGKLWVRRVDFNGNHLPYTMAARLNLEISWPVEIPYASRQKAYYTLEVFK